MLDSLLNSVSGLSHGDIAMWLWADKHPFLFTLIRVSTPAIWVVLLVTAGRLMGKYSNKKKSSW